jgi:putative glutamine amidotransferase
MIAIVNRISDNDFDYYKAKIDGCNGYWIKLDEDNPDYKSVLGRCGGVLITGAEDKGKYDLGIVRYALKHNLAIFGICQGIQDMVMAVSDESHIVPVRNHKYKYTPNEYYHRVDILSDSILYNIIGEVSINVNSTHNYQCYDVGDKNIFRVSAICSDTKLHGIYPNKGVIEGIENPNHAFQIGVQWHPEILSDESSKRLFSRFISVSSYIYSIRGRFSS